MFYLNLLTIMFILRNQFKKTQFYLKHLWLKITQIALNIYMNILPRIIQANINVYGHEVPYGAEVVKRFSFKYAYYLAVSKYFVFNVRQPLWYRKREGQVFVETWHGTPLKRLVFDQEEVTSASPKYKQQFYRQRQEWDYLVSANPFSTKTFRSCFMYEGKMLEYGYPRNDILYWPNKDQIAKDLRKKLGIPEDKKTILYAPTWRDDEHYGKGEYKFTLALDLKLMMEKLSDEYVVLLRTHHYIADNIDTTGLEGFVYNLSKYDDISEIYLISDICITDYSSVFFDYSITRKPIIPSEQEMEENSRSKSAKLRVFEKA